MEELRSDILKAASYIPGKHRLNLHEIYGDFWRYLRDHDQVEVKHFRKLDAMGSREWYKIGF